MLSVVLSVFGQSSTGSNTNHQKILSTFCEDILGQYGVKAGIDTIRHHMFIEINIIRTQHGLPALQEDSILNNIAQQHANYMFTNDKYSHFGPDGETPGKRAKAAGFLGYGVCENIDKGFSTLGCSINQRIVHPPHFENIINPSVSHLGVGYFGGNMTKNYIEHRCDFFVMDTGKK